MKPLIIVLSLLAIVACHRSSPSSTNASNAINAGGKTFPDKEQSQ